MPSTISIELSVTELTATNIGAAIADMLWTEDNVDELAAAIFSECQDEENEENLQALVVKLAEALSDE